MKKIKKKGYVAGAEACALVPRLESSLFLALKCRDSLVEDTSRAGLELVYSQKCEEMFWDGRCILLVVLVVFVERLYLGSLVGAMLIVAGLYYVLWGKSKDNSTANTDSHEKGKSCNESSSSSFSNIALLGPRRMKCVMDAKATRGLNFIVVLTRVEPTWEVSWFFVLHGVCTALEVLVKKSEFGEKWRLNRLVSGVLTIGFMMGTSFWLFFPQLVRNKADLRGLEEYMIVSQWLNDQVVRLI
ncbi:hypothetical protein Syun_022643 [Stephania yunnanensis]|uniref:Uncharacterized protein n=1 Tax=Stephania yunnanensis TaxID=152371 RepID=A0AAP0I1N8_9MAGN